MNPYHHPMRWMRWASIGAAVCGVMIAPLAASAKVLAPPGHPGVNQYVEVIPTSAGNALPPGSVSGSGSSNPGSGTLAGLGHGPSTDAKLAKLGTAGQAAAALAAATAPTPATRAARQDAAGAESGGGSLGSGIAHALTGSDTGGLGVA